jgi:hypothetical protein
MVLYTCNRCLKEFTKKCDYIHHTEKRKIPCKPIEDDLQNLTENELKLTEINKNNVDLTIINNNKIIENNICKYCCKSFINIYSLKRHYDGYCKVKKLDEEKKEDIFNKLLEKEEKFNILLNSFEKLQKITENLQKNNENLQKNNENLQKNYIDIKKNNKNLQIQIKELENKIKVNSKTYDNKIKEVITKNINNTVNNTINNINTDNSVKIIIPSEKLVKFGNEDLTKIDHKDIINSMKNWQVTGYHVFLELLKLIHFNPKLPEFQNVYMTDRNREKFMSYDGKIWELNDLALYETTQHIEKLKNAYEEEFEEEIKLNKSVKHTIDKLNKFTDKYFEGDEEGNKNNEFIKLVNGQIMDYMYNHREDIKINFEQIKDEIIKKNNDKLALNK